MRALLYCHLFPHRRRPSYGIFIYRMVERLVREGIDLDVVVPVALVPRLATRFKRWSGRPSPADLLDLPGAWVRGVSYVRPPGFWFRWFEGASMLAATRGLVTERHRRRPYDVIHCNMLAPDGEAALALARELGVPCVTTTMGQDIHVLPQVSRILRRRISRLLSETDQLIAVSQDIRREMEKLARPQRPIEVIYRGCDTRLFSPPTDRQAARRALQWNRDDLVCAYIGELVDTKGVPELLEAARQLRDEFFGLRLVLIGESRMQSRYHEFVRTHRLDGRVTMTGYLPPEQMPLYLGACDVFAFPSHTEGMPNSLVEAMSCGRACVATRVGGIPEIINDDENGLLIDVLRSDQLIASLRRVLGDEDLRSRLGAAARQTVLERFDADRNIKRLTHILRQLAEKR